MAIVAIGSHNAAEFIAHIEREGHGRGLLVRDYSMHAPGYAPGVPVYPDELLITDPAEQQKRLDDQIANRSSLWDLRMANYDILKSLDQNGYGLCWNFSTTKSNMYAKARMGGKLIRLAAYWSAGKVKNWRDEGGWGAESAASQGVIGVPEDSFCPAYNRKYDTPEAAANALLHRITTWYDGTENRERNRVIMISAFLLGLAPVLDYNWLSHSMCGCRLMSLNPLTIDTDNSWGETSQYGEKGCYRLTGSHAIPDNVVVPAYTTPLA